ncbi:DNA helicase B-like [Mercenaria mercenaria]|uniref:DNA helicase B-like n=1 Tax=Mercenaria mercenaria TaxID=6596 RepID=UPI00234FB538|nr:DNA helicase B-like [Mercenaria mercenaria]
MIVQVLYGTVRNGTEGSHTLDACARKLFQMCFISRKFLGMYQQILYRMFTPGDGSFRERLKPEHISMEQILNMVTGCLVLRDIEEGEDSEDEGGDDLQWVGYKEVAQLGRGKSLVPYEKTKRTIGDLIDLQTGRPRAVAGGFHLTDPWWQMTILRTKKSKGKFLEPKDYFALCYRLRDDASRFTDRVVHLFLSKLQDTLSEEDDNGTKVNISPWFSPARIQFETFLKERGQYDDLELLNLEERLEAYVGSFPEDEQTASSTQTRFKNAIIQSGEFRFIKVGETFPELLHYVPQLFPGNFKNIISLDDDKLNKLKTLLTDNPGLLAFKAILSKKCGILGCETSYDALTKSGLLAKVPQNIQDAILMYEFIKKDTKENGHTYIHFSRILDVLSPVVQLFEEGLEFLNKNKVTKTSVENGERHVFLVVLWKAENNIARGINSLIKQDERQPWKLEVDWETEDFESIRQDNDQLRAAKLIASKPVVAISGKGGCGKTYVVTKVITAAKATRQKQKDTETGTGLHDDAEAADLADRGDDSYEWKGDYPEEKEECPEKIELLLTAPTGKAANLLGKRAKCASFTLHQVIYSYRNQKNDNPWKHKDVNTLVVDECSLVSVSTFSFLIELLQEHAQLRKIVLLGDVRQLPSIEPGNFLSDTFISLARIGCAVELRNNHRAESARIIDNATRISKKIYPEFHPEQFSLRKLPYANPSSSGDDYTSQDISMEVMKLLNHDSLKDHVTSQFISFTRKVCDSINDLCCKRYSDHRTKEFGKAVFRTGDKICCTKNGYVNLYERSHGVMSCNSQATQRKVKEEESQGGVERTVNDDEDTSLLGNSGDQSTLNGSLDTTAAGSSKKKGEGSHKTNQIRLCNGEIFFIVEELETRDDTGKMRTFLQLSDKDKEEEFLFWVDKGQIKKACQIKHAWARTIHTFQGSETDNVVYIVGNGTWRQNWQHVYTAVTRGRKSVFIIGREDILRNAVKRSEIKRQTSLRKQLLELLQKNKDFNTTEAMQMSSMNITAFHPLSQRAPVKGNNSAVSKTVSVSHGQHKQPMKNELPSGSGDATLNNTQMVTDILSSLACEHDGQTESSDIDEYESDDFQSLFTKIKPARGKTQSHAVDSNSIPLETKLALDEAASGQAYNHEQNGFKLCHLNRGSGKQNVNHCDKNPSIFDHSNTNRSDKAAATKDCIRNMETEESGGEEEMDNGSDPESDDSQSLISPLTTRARSRAKATLELQKGNDKSKESVLNETNANQKHMSNSESVNLNDNKIAHLKGRNKNKLSLAKGKKPLSFIGSQSVETPLNISRGRKYRYSIQGVSSPITPLMNRTNFSPNIAGAQNTSSPVTGTSSDFQCHIRSGISPLTTDYDVSFSESKPVSLDSSVFSSSKRITMSPSNFNFRQDKARRLSELDDIKEPKSNESVQSQWSEIDESDYLKLVDESNLQQQNSGNMSGVIVSHKDGIDTSVTGNTSVYAKKQMLGIQTIQKNLNSTNMSVNSQWSEVDDEQYMTLDLEDINGMTCSNHDDSNMDNSDTRKDREGETSHFIKNITDKSPINERQILEDSLYRENTQIEVPEISVTHSPPSPSLFETPPRKLKLSPSRKRGLDVCDSDNIEVSPVKRSLSKLKF